MQPSETTKDSIIEALKQQSSDRLKLIDGLIEENDRLKQQNNSLWAEIPNKAHVLATSYSEN